MQTETLDKLYLEWSQFTDARTARELALQTRIAELESGHRMWAVYEDNGEIRAVNADRELAIDWAKHNTYDSSHVPTRRFWREQKAKGKGWRCVEVVVREVREVSDG